MAPIQFVMQRGDGKQQQKTLVTTLQLRMQLKEGYRSVKHVNCTEVKQQFRDEFIADSDLNAFLSESTLGLKTSAGQDNDTQLRVNICNEVRRRRTGH